MFLNHSSGVSNVAKGPVTLASCQNVMHNRNSSTHSSISQCKKYTFYAGFCIHWALWTQNAVLTLSVAARVAGIWNIFWTRHGSPNINILLREHYKKSRTSLGETGRYWFGSIEAYSHFPPFRTWSSLHWLDLLSKSLFLYNGVYWGHLVLSIYDVIVSQKMYNGE